MNVVYSTITDFEGWIALAREVEPLFGPMADESAFHDGLRQAISQKMAFCIRSNSEEKNQPLKGGIVISKESNEIVWLAVSKHSRKMGVWARIASVRDSSTQSSRRYIGSNIS